MTTQGSLASHPKTLPTRPACPMDTPPLIGNQDNSISAPLVCGD